MTELTQTYCPETQLDEDHVPQMFTSLPDGSKVRKDDLRMEACGTVDELNSFIGLLAADSPLHISEELHHIQRKLFAIGAHLVGVATPKGYPGDEDIQQMKARIAEFQQVCGKFHSFVLPGGCRAAALSHVCRTVCRRAERCAVSLNSYSDVLYLNRLSTYFFYLSTYFNNFNGNEEIKV